MILITLCWGFSDNAEDVNFKKPLKTGSATGPRKYSTSEYSRVEWETTWWYFMKVLWRYKKREWKGMWTRQFMCNAKLSWRVYLFFQISINVA